MKENIINALSIMWKGMLAISIAIAVIAFVTFLLKRSDAYTARKKKEQKPDDRSEEGGGLSR